MNSLSNNRHSFSLALLAAVGLVLAGVGCQGSVPDQVAGEAINGMVATPLKALDKAKKLSAEENARTRLESEGVANEMTVAMVLTDNAAAPRDAEIGATFGCNDRVAFTKVARASDSGETLKDILNSLLAVHDSNVNGLYNGLADSRLTLDKLQSRDGVTTEVWLKGKISSSGACDDPRIKAQLEATIARYKPKFQIFLNGTEDEYRCIGDMGGQCGQGKKK